MNNKKQIRLTESDLKQIVKESVNKILDEAYGTPTNATKELINRYKNKEDDGFSGIRTIYNQLSSLAERTDQYTTLTPLDDNFRIPRKYVELIRKHIHKAMDVCQMVMNKVVMSQGEQPESHRSPYSRDYFDKRKPQGYGGYGGGEQRDFSGLPGWGG